MVKLTRNIICRLFRNTHITVKQQNTALLEIEAVLHSRPLVPLSPDTSEDAIIPSMFITGFNTTSLPDHFFDINNHLSSRWRKTKCFFKKDFVKNGCLSIYLIFNGLKKWRHAQRNLKVDNLVVVVDKIQGSLEWPLGRIINVYPGSDALIRTAEAKPSNEKVYQRPTIKLALVLPAQDI
ncbi:unnamed protein product [Lepeophtheirus salmonis]|uniref:(salmon louse) hypothetical protein n=1 Tax=Lepeophtheirus salmonis TaxID=72036 RepID=A0A7R8D659_LEPSM|nr:unnamed protein product [Lepeophtheirus salmonis]CAF3041774.1 unnamed protein product [Lepeophtheirus salmonis]